MKIRVPATSANLGPGFDVCGLALNLYNDYQLVAYNQSNNLADQAFAKYYEYIGRPKPDYSVLIEPANIPRSRGLGSSASVIVGGITLANCLEGNLLTDDELLFLANQLEGHPDNVAPALLGGLVISTVQNGQVRYKRFELKEDLHFNACVPSYELSTAEARKVLPASIPRAQAVSNIANTSLLLLNLISGDYQNLTYFFEDFLHEPYRGPLIPEYPMIKGLMSKKEVYGAYISGAGPTMMVLSQDSLIGTELFDSPEFSAYQFFDLTIDNQGYQIIE